MRILALSDPHGRYGHIPALLSLCQPDVVLIAGDVTHFGPAEAALELFELVDCPVLAVAGNCDPLSITEVFEEHGANLNDGMRTLEDVYFVGVGGSNITPFNTIFERGEEEIEAAVSGIALSGKHSLLLAHCPPLGWCDLTHRGVHAGCESVRKIGANFELIVCGHIHEARGIERMRNAVVVNPGPAFQGFGACIEIGGNIKVELVTVP
jgi:hypothetical protein